MSEFWCEKSQRLLEYASALQFNSVNQNGAASKKSHGVDLLDSRKCAKLSTHPYASSLRQPYKNFRGDLPRLAGIFPENRFLDRSLPWVYQRKNPFIRVELDLSS